MKPTALRFALTITLVLCLAPFLWTLADDPAPPKIKAGEKKEFKGKVVPLDDLLKKVGSRLDSDARKHWVALVCDDGQIYPLIKEDRSRMFFQEPKVQNRQMIITGRLSAGTHLLQVLDVKSVLKGHVHDIYYWCDICAIRRPAGGVCECCGGPMELREIPLRK